MVFRFTSMLLLACEANAFSLPAGGGKFGVGSVAHMVDGAGAQPSTLSEYTQGEGKFGTGSVEHMVEGAGAQDGSTASMTEMGKFGTGSMQHTVPGGGAQNMPYMREEGKFGVGSKAARHGGGVDPFGP